LRKLERNWQKWKSVSLEEKPWRRDNVRIEDNRLDLFPFLFLFLDLGLGVSIMSHITVTQKAVEGYRTMILDHISFRVG